MPSTRGTYRDERLDFARVLAEWADIHRVALNIADRALLLVGTSTEAHFVRTLRDMDADHAEELEALVKRVREETP